ncbi:MAG: right-handed parallel beta-helix repeat-containing protein [Bacteroidales bacterium]
MKRIVIFAGLFVFAFQAIAQYTTPGTGINWSLTDLVENSGGVVTTEGSGIFTIHNELVVSASDTIAITDAAEIKVADAVLITFTGTLLANPPDDEIVFFKAKDNYYEGLRFEDQNSSYLRNVYFKKAGGIQLVNADITFENCDFTEFDQENSTGTIDLFQSDPLISNCNFDYNAGPAVMSGANASSSPQIINCTISYNVQSNSNTPQINLGTSGTDSTRIIGNVITGDTEKIKAGGIAITTMAGGSIKARIEGNVIRDNRYGITAYGSNIGSVIRNNEIADNNTQNIPMQGGSGINFYGNETNHSVVTGNVITGNLWGITIEVAAKPNLGKLEGADYNPGMNQLYNNSNNGEIYNLYNNTAGEIWAQNNYWGTLDPDTVEMHIFHQPDDPELGPVNFLPLYNPPVNIRELSFTNKQMVKQIFPNPAFDHVNLVFNEHSKMNNPLVVELYNLSGEFLKRLHAHPLSCNRIDMPADIRPGVYVLRFHYKGIHENHKIILQ